MDWSPPGSFVHGIPQARILEGVAISFSRGSSQTRNQTRVPCIGRRILCHWASREVQECVGGYRNMRRVWCHSSDAACARYGQTYNFLAISHPKAGNEATEVGMEELEKTFTSWEKECGFDLEDSGWRWLLVCFGKSLWFLGDKALVWWSKPGADSRHGRWLQSSGWRRAGGHTALR